MSAQPLKDSVWLIIAIPVVILVFLNYGLGAAHLRIMLYSAVLYSILFFILFLIYKIKVTWLSHLGSLFVVYLLVQFVFASSPWLQLKEFEWTHPQWQVAENVHVIDMTQEYHGRRKEMGYNFMTIIYQYDVTGKQYSTEQSDLVRQYHLWLTDDRSTLRGLSQAKLEQALQDQAQIVLFNSANPAESIFFYSQDWVDFRGSWFARLFYFSQLILIGALLWAGGMLIKKVVNPKDTFQTWSKPKRYAFIAVFFIVGWSVLFAGWILLMYIKNAP